MRLFLSSQDFGNYPQVVSDLVGNNKKAAFIKNAHDDLPVAERNFSLPEKKRMLTDINSALDSPGAILSTMFQAKMFPKHPYGRDRFQEAKKVPKITSAHLEKLHKRIFAQKQVIAVVGDIEPEKEPDRTFE